MSNILIIKHGSLGDIAQVSGVLRDIREAMVEKKIFILTTLPYIELLSRCPYIDGVLLDKRLPRWNIFYLLKLRKLISKFKFSQVFDLQNSRRTSFYRKYLFNISNWSSTEMTLKEKIKKSEFDKESVLKRFILQLNSSNIKTIHSMKPDFSWATVNVDKIVNQYFGKKFILLFPFSSPEHIQKRWPYYNDLIKLIKDKHNYFDVAVSPAANEIEEAKKIDAVCITNNNIPLDIMELSGLIEKASFVISNDTGPAHIAAHLGKKGIAIFGHHTSPSKVSIDTDKFKSIVSKDLGQLKPEEIYLKIKDQLNSIN